MPAPITKEAVVDEVRRRSGSGLLEAAGDSRLDAGFLGLAEIAIRPPHGELDSDAFTLPNLTVTSASGILAGEEILRFVTGVLVETLVPLP